LKSVLDTLLYTFIHKFVDSSSRSKALSDISAEKADEPGTDKATFPRQPILFALMILTPSNGKSCVDGIEDPATYI